MNLSSTLTSAQVDIRVELLFLRLVVFLSSSTYNGYSLARMTSCSMRDTLSMGQRGSAAIKRSF